MFSHLCRPGLSHLQIRTFPFDPATRLVVFCDWCGGGNACCKPLGDQFHSPACWDGHKEGDSTLGLRKSPHFFETILGRSIIITVCFKRKRYMYSYNHVSVHISHPRIVCFWKAWFRRFSKRGIYNSPFGDRCKQRTSLRDGHDGDPIECRGALNATWQWKRSCSACRWVQ